MVRVCICVMVGVGLGLGFYGRGRVEGRVGVVVVLGQRLELVFVLWLLLG